MAATVWRGIGPLEHKQTEFGRGLIDATGKGFAHERIVIGVGGIASQGKPEAILARQFAMATARIATKPGQDRDHSVFKRRNLRTSPVGAAGNDQANKQQPLATWQPTEFG